MPNPFFVVFARPGGLDGLPCEDVADCVVAIALQAGEVDVGIFLAKWSAVKFDVVAVKEMVDDMRGNFGSGGVFGFAGYVDASQKNIASIFVLELAVFNCESQGGRHGMLDSSDPVACETLAYCYGRPHNWDAVRGQRGAVERRLSGA